jgi:hypothetical protein
MKSAKPLLAGAFCAWIASGSMLSAQTKETDDDHFARQYPLENGKAVVVAEGDLEPRSIGSYSVRLYAGANNEHPTDDFVTGIIRPRDGTIEKVLLKDITGDGKKEIIVVTRSVGTGDYLSADAFAIGVKSLTLKASVEALPKDADPITALEKKLKRQHHKQASSVKLAERRKS